MRALGANGQVLIDLIPELELIVGPQPGVLELGPTESQNRFNLLFSGFVRVFTGSGSPLVLFLDDLPGSGAPRLRRKGWRREKFLGNVMS